LLAAGVSLVLFSPTARAEFRLDSGDQIEVVIAGMKDFQYRSPIDLNGEVSLPVFGNIKARGLTLAELRAQIEALLPTKVLFRRSDDGRKSAINFNSDELMVSVVEYRPVYVSGDVLKAGSVPFRPGLTIRQALAVAGGTMMASMTGMSPMDLIRLQGDREAMTLEYAKAAARVWRLESELKKTDTPPPSDLLVEKDIAERIIKLELDEKKARQTALDSDKEHLRDSITQMDQRIATLMAQSEKETKINESDQQDLASLNTSLQKGNSSIFLVSEARRAALTSATRMLQTNVLLADAHKDRDEMSRRLAKVDEDRRVEALTDLQTANANLLTAASRLRAIGLRVALPSSATTAGSSPSITVYRKTDDKEEQLAGRPDMELMPGDVIAVGAASGTLAALGN
jgi:polysaccharide export outer membrane protein